MKRLIINKLDRGYFGIRSNFVEREDVEVLYNGETYLVKRGTKPHRISLISSKFRTEPMEIWMYRLPVIASEENQMRLF